MINMKIVKENINFKRGKDPKQSLDIGKESSYSREQILQKFSEMGVEVSIDFDPLNPPKVLENIYQIKEYVDKLLNLGVKPSDIEIAYPDSVCIKGFTVKDSNQVLLHCLTEKDATIIARTLKKFMINGDRINIDRSSMNPYIHFNKENEWLNGLKENREIYEKCMIKFERNKEKIYEISKRKLKFYQRGKSYG